MASYTLELPDEIVKEINSIENGFEKIFGGMTKAGAEVVLHNVLSFAPPSWHNSNIMNNIKLTRVYRTPSDDGINTKVTITGYFYNHNNVLTPAPLVANAFEYGTSTVTKQPFFRRSFRKSEIERAMLEAQKELSGGLLDE